MKVAKITCLTRMVRIPDLDLALFKGDIKFLTEEEVNRSPNLALMERMSAIDLVWVRRRALEEEPKPVAAVKPPDVRPNVRNFPRRILTREDRERAYREAPKPPEVDLEQLADKLAARKPSGVVLPFVTTSPELESVSEVAPTKAPRKRAPAAKKTRRKRTPKAEPED